MTTMCIPAVLSTREFLVENYVTNMKNELKVDNPFFKLVGFILLLCH